MKNNLWILTEEKPKKEVLKVIFDKFAKDNHFAVFVDTIRILPTLDNGKFTFLYEVRGFHCEKIEKVFIKTISGTSSFTDFLVFYQENEPVLTDTPLYAIEETKTDDSESRNTGVYQRCSKFVFIENKSKMRSAPRGNVPIAINKYDDRIEISGRLYKSGGLSHDPNIGALSIISAVIRKLGWEKEIVITQHGLSQSQIGRTNKFIQIANKLNISLQGLELPNATVHSDYWKYDTEGEKLGTIFIQLVVENFTQGQSIFENHAGSEKGYFVTAEGKYIPLAKYKDRALYKAGDKLQIINIPDLILIDFERTEIINIEGKKYSFRKQGISELANYDFIEKNYVLKYYPKFKIIRTVVLAGSNEEKIIEIEVGFL